MAALKPSDDALAPGRPEVARLGDRELERLWRKRRLADLPRLALHEASMVAARAAQKALSRLPHGVWESDGSRLVTVDRLDRDSLLGLLVRHDVCGIRVPGFCSPAVAERLAQLAHGERTRWALRGNVETDMFYVGGSIPVEVAQRERNAFFRYFGEREQFVEAQRRASAGQWPVDRLVEELSRVWPAGAEVSTLGGQPARPAIMRAMGPAREAGAPARGFAHVDGPPPRSTLGNGSANIYVDVPERGGELLLWNVNLKQGAGLQRRAQRLYLQALLATAFDPPAQERLLAQLPPPIEVRPQVGDLILLHTGRPHAVVPIGGGFRANLQSFVLMQGVDNALEVFC